MAVSQPAPLHRGVDDEAGGSDAPGAKAKAKEQGMAGWFQLQQGFMTLIKIIPSPQRMYLCYT